MTKSGEITLKNTKAEILEALNAALKREKDINKMKSDPVKEEKAKKEKAAIKNTKENVEKNIFSQELINKFNELELAISTLENKLKDLYGVEKELNNLTVIMNAGKDCIANIEEEKLQKKQELEEKIKKLDEEYKEKKRLAPKDIVQCINYVAKTHYIIPPSKYNSSLPKRVAKIFPQCIYKILTNAYALKNKCLILRNH